MSADNTTKEQRDRFLAFAFAGAELMLEVGEDGYISFALGAAKGLTGNNDASLQGKELVELFAPRDRGLISSLRARAVPGKRFGPVLVHLNETHTNMPVAMLSGLAIPAKAGTVYITLSRGTYAQVAQSQEERANSESGLLDKETFTKAALEMVAASDTLGEKLGLTFVDLPDAKNFKGKIGAEKWGSFRENVSTLLRSYAADGRAAAAMDDGRYGLVHVEGLAPEKIQRDIEALSRETDPDKQGLSSAAQTLHAGDAKLSERELAKALMYTINQFEKKGSAFNILSLENSFENFLQDNAKKISDLKSVINQSRFEMKYQPIVNLKDGSVAYYEALLRFEDGVSPFEMITFCEDVGLSPELDLAVCGKIINYIVFQAPKDTVFSVNLSGISIQNDKFIANLREKLEPHLKKGIAKRMVFEITESSQITDLDKVNSFVRALQYDGFKVALDDFGAGSASFQYLHKIHVDAVKIDGLYIMNILTNERDKSMITNLVRMCADLGVDVVAERVETEEQAALLKTINVDMAQGYYFAKPLDAPNYKRKHKT